MTLGEKLQELRKSRLMSQERFAEEMDVTRQAVSKWELNQAYPEMEKLIEISEYFDVSMDFLVKNQKDMASGKIEVPETKAKGFDFVKLFIMIILAIVMTSFRFFITQDFQSGLYLILLAGCIGIGLFIFRVLKSRA